MASTRVFELDTTAVSCVQTVVPPHADRVPVHRGEPGRTWHSNASQARRGPVPRQPVHALHVQVPSTSRARCQAHGLDLGAPSSNDAGSCLLPRNRASRSQDLPSTPDRSGTPFGIFGARSYAGSPETIVLTISPGSVTLLAPGPLLAPAGIVRAEKATKTKRASNFSKGFVGVI